MNLLNEKLRVYYLVGAFSLKFYTAFIIVQLKQPRLVKAWLNFDLNFIFKSSGTALLKTIVSYQTPPSFSQENRKTLLPAPQYTLTAAFVCISYPQCWTEIGKSKKFRSTGMKVQVKRDFKSYFCHQKIIKKVDKQCIKLSSTSSTSEQRCLYSFISKSVPPFSAAPLFQRISQPSVQDQKNGK